MAMTYTTLSDIQGDWKAQKITLPDLVRHCLRRIEETASLNAYIEVWGEEALARAQVLEEKYRHQPTAIGKLFGMVISIKDLICYEGHQVNAASKILEGFTSLYSATAVERLLAADAILIGRTNCDAFGMGSTNENSYFGATRHPIDPTKVPGGSSGGAAVAVQTGTCLAALGTDTGGSVRQPAGFCGIVGLKPTYGRISRHGVIAYASSFDQIGIFSHSIADTALVLEVIAGSDEYDSTAAAQPVPPYSQHLSFTEKATLVYFEEALAENGMDTAIRAQTLAYFERLRQAGHTVRGVSFDLLPYLVPAYYVLTTAEASSNLSRYDGIRYGYRAPEATTLEDVYTQSRTEGFSEEVKRRILLGTFVLSSGYYDAYYTKAQQVRRLIQEKTLAILAEVDFILMPVSPIPAWDIGAKTDDPVAMYLADIYTVQANMVGLPALSLPIGNDAQGMPIGIQLMANRWEEQQLLSFAAHCVATV